jgi:alpha-galactosidase
MSSAPFAKYLSSNSTWQSPASLLALYKGKVEDSLTNEDFRSLVRENLPSIPEEGIMYCTWLPFLKNINEELCLNLAEQAAQFNFKYFVLDDGWFDEKDRRNVDANKFPNGLAPLAQKVQSLGMTFGLWLNIGTDYGLNGIVPKEWYAQNSSQKANRLGFNYETSKNAFCLASSYRQYVIDTLNDLVANLQVGYFKLDFSNVMSPYGILPWGCHCKNHQYHKGFEDSFIGFYEGMKAIRDGVLAKYPNVIIDFSFETFGTERPNIAALEYSALHHATNSSANNVEYQRIDRVRRNFYDWLEKLPPERILNGLLSIQGDNAAEYLLSSFAGAPLVAGDLLKITKENAQRIKLFTSCFKQLSSKGAMTEFYLLENTLDFDGFIRYSKKGHGLVALFNRKNTDVRVTLPSFAQNAIDVETNKATNIVKANSCLMLVF